jgi:hypothetical protein
VTRSGVEPSGNGAPSVVGRVLYQGELVALDARPAARPAGPANDQSALVQDGTPVAPALATAIGRARDALHALKATQVR